MICTHWSWSASVLDPVDVSRKRLLESKQTARKMTPPLPRGILLERGGLFVASGCGAGFTPAEDWNYSVLADKAASLRQEAGLRLLEKNLLPDVVEFKGNLWILPLQKFPQYLCPSSHILQFIKWLSFTSCVSHTFTCGAGPSTDEQLGTDPV